MIFKMNSNKIITLITALFIFVGGKVWAQSSKSNPTIVGAMKNVMKKGELFGTIHLDTLSPKKHLYGMGPLAFLKGEILIFDGITYSSKVVSKSKMSIAEDDDIQAPFFAYATIEQWQEVALPDSVRTIETLAGFLDQYTAGTDAPFMFRLEGTISNAIIHIVNLPDGATVASPEQAHEGKTNYALKKTEVDILGFFSRNHQSIFTHHDTFLHLHLISKDRKKMGHLDELNFKQGTMKLYLPL